MITKEVIAAKAPEKLEGTDEKTSSTIKEIVKTFI